MKLIELIWALLLIGGGLALIVRPQLYQRAMLRDRQRDWRKGSELFDNWTSAPEFLIITRLGGAFFCILGTFLAWRLLTH